MNGGNRLDLLEEGWMGCSSAWISGSMEALQDVAGIAQLCGRHPSEAFSATRRTPWHSAD